MGEHLGCHVISLGTEKYDTSTSLLTDLEDEHIVLTMDPVRESQSGNAYLKYDVTNPIESLIAPAADPKRQGLLSENP